MASLSVLNILRTIKERGAVSRTDLQHTTGLSWGTITNTTRDLLNRNLIREEGALSTKAGRKPVRLAINPSSHSLIGVDIGRKVIRCLMLSLAGEMLWYDEFAYAPNEAATEALDRAAALVQRAMEMPAVSSRICLGVGVSAPGAIDVRNGTMRFAPQMPAWKNVPVRQILQGQLTPRVYIEHDPNCLAMAERWFGEAGHAEDVLCVNLGEGVGMGILFQGEVFRGSQQLAGEFGHITLDPNGPLCACGDRGCVESYCSIPAIIDYVRSVPDQQSADLAAILQARPPTIAELTMAARNGDRAALGAFERAGTYLGIGLANLVDLFNPDLIVLAGSLILAREFFMPALDREVQKHAWKHSNRQMLLSQLGERAMAMGACGMVLQSVFNQDLLATAELAQI
ncbi:MAG TPA: ROK family protein [Phycisphaerae bacterium]|nr:ROK family protein [Phycisphaerae bacterium]